MYSNLSPISLEHFNFFLLHFFSNFKNACGKNRLCRNNAICQSGITDKGYKCLCNTGFQGEHCEGTHIYVIKLACSVWYYRNIGVFVSQVYEPSPTCEVHTPFLNILWTVIRTWNILSSKFLIF